MKKEDKKKLVERLANLEHKQWMEWAYTIMKTESLSQERLSRWAMFFCDYKELPEAIKRQDRKWAKKVLKIMGF